MLKNLSQEKIDYILQALEAIEYGSILIVVHDSQIIQVERTEKKRFSTEPPTPKNRRSQASTKKKLFI
ncbi:YezD family protein [Aneurinibacillus sp. Ricciae_BoGa-3]|uniref:YezD family protein n=1 Tax=Aneurinibacillus sp. Ricciae_BoGa-3 TaxID=3022697 RepID=UPI002341E2DE|nr:YezD family protein [Aneurinibacillus sp. Ricciae_BoGa-3]WCK56208.1 YezD family protein [Aneurinibacillus sp. Ricciae_BoGa-3]